MEYLGDLGRLVPLRCASSERVAARPRYITRNTLEGVLRAQELPSGPRSWDVTWNAATPGAAAALQGFTTGAWGSGPWVWVPIQAQHGNVLTPRQSVFLDHEPGGSWNDGPPLALPDGSWAPRTLVSTMTSAYNMFFRDLPVLPGRAVTFTAWVLGDGTNVPQLALSFYDSAGNSLDSGASAFESAPDAHGIHRVSMTRTPPQESVSAAVGVTWRTRRIAQPQVTWTDGPVPYAFGSGCTAAIVDDYQETPLLVTPRASYSEAGFRVMEVG